MKVLWFCNTPSLYKQNAHSYNGGGWISSLEVLMAKHSDIELGICFLHSDKTFKVKQGNTTYYPIALYVSKLQKLKHNLLYSHYDSVEVNEYLKVINDFKPDIIHVFGSEQSFGLVSLYTKIPVVIHIQGILNPYLNAMFAPGVSRIDYLQYLGLKEGVLKLKDILFFSHNSKREETILKSCSFFMGRTNWDKKLVKLFAPDSEYFYCSEILRNAFYNARPWTVNKNVVFSLVTTISKTDYKGFDLILKTASLLMQMRSFKFEWKVFGISSYTFWERKLNIKAKDVNVNFMGIASSELLISAFHTADLYIHPSYIDNSPNSICEAQIVGVPIISTNVGGISSLITDKKTGSLVPANDPYELAYQIIYLRENPEYTSELALEGRRQAQKRHNIEDILSQNLLAYQTIVKRN